MDEEKNILLYYSKTKANITVDIAGYPIDYDGIKRKLNREDIIFQIQPIPLAPNIKAKSR